MINFCLYSCFIEIYACEKIILLKKKEYQNFVFFYDYHIFQHLFIVIPNLGIKFLFKSSSEIIFQFFSDNDHILIGRRR